MSLKINNSNNILRINNNTKCVLTTYSKEIVMENYIYTKTAPFNSDRISYVEYLDRANQQVISNNNINNTIIDKITVSEYIVNVLKLSINNFDIKISNLINNLTVDIVKLRLNKDLIQIANNINNGVEGYNINMLIPYLFSENDFTLFIDKLLVDIIVYNISKSDIINYILTNNIIVNDIYVDVLDRMDSSIIEEWNKKVIGLLNSLILLPFNNYYRKCIVDNLGDMNNFLCSKDRYSYLKILSIVDFSKISYIVQMDFLKFLFGESVEMDILDIDLNILENYILSNL